MQTLDVISVNIWQILISLANLIIIFIIIKKFLFKPVKNIVKKREDELNSQYEQARLAENNARLTEEKWNEKIATADKEADNIISNASTLANSIHDRKIKQAELEAQNIIQNARTAAELEMKKAQESIKEEIVDVSQELTKKLLAREINKDDHKELIDAFISEIDENKKD